MISCSSTSCAAETVHICLLVAVSPVHRVAVDGRTDAQTSTNTGHLVELARFDRSPLSYGNLFYPRGCAMTEPPAKKRDVCQRQDENGEGCEEVHIGGKYIVQRSDGEWRNELTQSMRNGDHVMSFYCSCRYC